MKKRTIFSLIVIVIIGIYIVLHSNPKLSVRTHLFFKGYVLEAVNNEIIPYIDKNDAENERNISLYKLSNPPVEKDTQGELKTYIVYKKGILYFAKYYGEA